MPKIIPVQQPMLISKMQNINISAFKSIKDEYKGVKIPKAARVFDLVKVINKRGFPVDIITFRNKVVGNQAGIVVRRYFIEQLPLYKAMTQKDYKYQPVSTDSENEIMERQVTTTIRQGSAKPKHIDETQVVVRANNAPKLYIKKIESQNYLPSFDVEKQGAYCYQKDQEKKGYEIGPYLRTKDSFFKLTPFTYHFENFSEESIEKLVHDKYFPLHLYSFEEFKKIAPSVASHPEHQAKYPCEIIWTDKLVPKMYGHMVADLSNNNKNIYLSKKLNDSRYILINASAHEQEHAYECEQVYNLLLHDAVVEQYVLEPTEQNLRKCRLANEYFPVENFDKAEQYKEDYRDYVQVEDNKEDYFSQDAETRARVAGYLAIKEYSASVQRLKKEFMDAPDSFIGATQAEKNMYTLHRNPLQEMFDINKVKSDT